MSRVLKLVFVAIFACVFQTNLSQYMRIASIAPDMLCVFLVLLTSYTGAYGGFCVGSVMAMLYDASVGYVLAVNLVGYTFIGWAAPMLRVFLNAKLKKLKHKSYLVMMIICFFLTLMREIIYLGYLFLIGAEQGIVTLVRAVFCAGYSSLLIIPGVYVMKKIMNWKIHIRKKGLDLKNDDVM